MSVTVPLLSVLLAWQGSAQELDRDTVPAAGRQQVDLEIPRFGRYAISVTSDQGTGLQLVDRMTGAGPMRGAPGRQDGRVDAFLEPGEVRVVTHAHADGRGEAALSVRPFRDVSGDAPLPRHEVVEATLSDLEQRGWWIDVSDRREVALEAAGRHLADLRLWRDGRWLDPAEPACAEIAPSPGRPLQHCTLTASVEPGRYRVMAYGGPGAPWSEPSDTAPLYVRRGLPRLGDAGRLRGELGPFGIDRYVIPEGATHFRLALPEHAPASLSVGRDPSRPFDGGRTAFVTESSRLPVAETRASGAGDRVVTVTGPPGQAYTLEHLAPTGRDTWLDVRGAAFVSTVQTGDPADHLPPTGVLYRRTPRGDVLVDKQVLPLDPRHRFEERFDLRGSARLFVEVLEEATYAFSAPGARVGVHRLFTSPPPDAAPPKVYRDRVSRELSPGLYEVLVEPVKRGEPGERGPVTLTVAPDTWTGWARGLVGADAPVDRVTLPPGLRFDRVDAGSDRIALLHSRQDGVDIGVIARPLPLDPTDPVPVALDGRELAEIPVRASTPGTLTVLADDGTPLDVSLGGDWSTSLDLPVGAHAVTIRNPNARPVQATLAMVPREGAAPPTVDLPVLSPDAPAHVTLARGQQVTWQLDVSEPALYTLRTTGLLATEGRLRTRTRTALDTAAENGVGRNFDVARYLTPGAYQVTVGARGDSAGRAGLALEKTALIDGGALQDGIPARISLPAGRAAAWTFTATEPGRYALRSFGRGRGFSCRVEDADGYPIGAPDGPCDTVLDLTPGTFRILGLPEQVATRRITELRRIDSDAELAGPGPHPLPLDEARTHTWREPEGDRAPHVWAFSLPADAEVTVSLSDEMVGAVLRGDEPIARLVPGRPFTGALPSGDYRIEVRAAREDDGVVYRIAARPTPLVAGVERDVSLPASLPLVVGDHGLTEIVSFGDADVRARLRDDRGRLVAHADDRPDDWNFRLSERLPAGRYTLEVDAVDGRPGETRIAVSAPDERDGPGLGLGDRWTVTPGDSVHLNPLDVGDAPVLVVHAAAPEAVGIAVEARDGDRWRTLATETGHDPLVALRPLPNEPHRLRLWSLDQRGNEAHVTVSAPTPARVPEGRLARGATLKGDDGPLGAAVTEGPAGLFAISGDRDVLRVCPAPGQACAPAEPVVASTDGLWLVGAGTHRAERLVVGDAAVTAPVPPDHPIGVDLDGGGGPLLVTATSPTGQPGVAIAGPRGGVDASVTTFSDGAATALDLAGRGRSAALWSASGEPLDARVTRVRFSRPMRIPADHAVYEGALAPREALTLGIPRGSALRLTLEPDVVAAFDDALHRADGSDLVVDRADDLTLLNPTDAPLRWAVAVLPAGEAPAPIGPNTPFERVVTGRRTFRVPVAAGPGALSVRGAEPVYVRADGRVDRSPSPEVGPGGTLVLHAAPGTVLAWVGDGPWRDARTGRPARVTGADRVPLDGDARALDLDLDHPSLVTLRAETPYAARVRLPDGTTRVHLRERGGALSTWLPDGRAEVTLRALAGGALWGEATVTHTAATPIGEGLGPEVLVPPGGARLFSFTVDRDGPVGVGVDAAADRVEATVLDATGRPVSTGLVQMPELTAGDWLLALTLSDDAAPVRARPALAGVEPPDTGPPDEVVRGYLELAGLSPNGGAE